jgi:hypothetical protein
MSKSTAKIENIVILVLLVIGFIGAISIFRPSEDAFASPNHQLENNSGSYQISLETSDTKAYSGLALEE